MIILTRNLNNDYPIIYISYEYYRNYIILVTYNNKKM